MLNGTYTAAPYPVIIVAVSRLLRGYRRLIRISKNAQIKEELHRIFFSILRIKISIPIMDPVVICSFAMINDKPSLRFPFPNLPSTALRSPISCNSWRISSAWSFPGRPSFGPEIRIPRLLQNARLFLLRYILSARIRSG